MNELIHNLFPDWPKIRPLPICKVSIVCDQKMTNTYKLFHRFRQAQVDNGGPILSSSQFLLLPQLSQKMKFATKVFKMDQKK